MVTAQQELLSWYRAQKRDLPWRQTREPYRILVSEMMLQQTQVERVKPFFARFLEQFPDEAALAAADDESIHRAWKGLGYPNRVERLRASCRVVLARGSWPDTPEGLRELPGIGPYTAGAVAVFAFGQAVPVVDTNVARVYARRLGLPLPLSPECIWTVAAEQLDAQDPIAYTNALMDLGATVCTARAPRCAICPWLQRCATASDQAYQSASGNPLKVASPKVAYGVAPRPGVPRLHIALALIHHDGRYLVARRPKGRHHAECWEIPGGKREPGEDIRTTLAREVHEELGGEVLSARTWVDWSWDYGETILSFHTFRCRLFAPEVVRPLASLELRWVTPKEFVALEFPPANTVLAARMRAYHRL